MKICLPTVSTTSFVDTFTEIFYSVGQTNRVYIVIDPEAVDVFTSGLSAPIVFVSPLKVVFLGKSQKKSSENVAVN